MNIGGVNRPDCAATELFDFDGNPIVGHTVESDDKCWYAKTAPHAIMADRDLLGYILGAGTVNVAEIRRLENPAVVTLPDGSRWVPQGAHELLVRLGEDYVPDELPLRDLDEAVAYELVFSLWIRRRDATLGTSGMSTGYPCFSIITLRLTTTTGTSISASFFIRSIPTRATADPGV